LLRILIAVYQTPSRASAASPAHSEDGSDMMGGAGGQQNFRVGKLNLVDLAGSERVRYLPDFSFRQ
jgi:hypothetical protein